MRNQFFIFSNDSGHFFFVNLVNLISEPDLSKCSLRNKTTLSLNKISLQTPIEPFDQYPIRGDYMKHSFYLIPCILERKPFHSQKKDYQLDKAHWNMRKSIWYFFNLYKTLICKLSGVYEILKYPMTISFG